MKETLKLPISSIKTGDRIRADYKDLEVLSESILANGLIQPIVVNQHNQLIAGGRRLAACKLLEWEEIPVVFLETMDESQLRILEIEENVRREPMSWQEQVLGIAYIHILCRNAAVKKGQVWKHDDTAQRIGFNRSYVSYALSLAKHLKDPNSEVSKCEGITEAVKLLAKRREQELMKEFAKQTSVLPPTISVADAPELPLTAPPTSTPDAPKEKIEISLSNIVHGEAIQFMSSNPGCCHHIITDPPYGIEMSNLHQDQGGFDLDEVEVTHDVEENLKMFPDMLKGFHTALQDDGFVIFWCDYDHWNFLSAEAAKVGFKVQRWPLTWVKLHPCLNQTAHVNFTKTTEIAMVLRKGKPRLPKPVTLSHILCSNDQDKRDFDHPFVKPYELWKFCIESVSIQGQIILDAYAGAGSSTLAALRLGRRPIAVEISSDIYPKLNLNVRRFYETRIPNVIFT